MEPVAQTNLQLYNQLRAQGYIDEQLAVVHRAYEFLITIYPGYHQADGRPFVAHTVGVASILGYLNFPVDFVAVGLLHNLYGNGDFGDGLSYVATKRRRRIVREAVGEPIEAAIDRFPKCRINQQTLPNLMSSLDQPGEIDKKLIVIDLADYLEKYIDLGVCYWGNSRWVTDAVGKQPELDLCITHLQNFWISELKAEAEHFSNHRLSKPMPGYFMLQTLLVRRHVFDAIGLFNTELQVCEDVEWFLRAVERSMIILVLHDILLYRRLHTSNISRMPATQNVLLGIVKASSSRSHRVRDALFQAVKASCCRLRRQDDGMSEFAEFLTAYRRE